MLGKWNMGSDAKAETKPRLDLGAAHYVGIFVHAAIFIISYHPISYHISSIHERDHQDKNQLDTKPRFTGYTLPSLPGTLYIVHQL